MTARQIIGTSRLDSRGDRGYDSRRSSSPRRREDASPSRSIAAQSTCKTAEMKVTHDRFHRSSIGAFRRLVPTDIRAAFPALERVHQGHQRGLFRWTGRHTGSRSPSSRRWPTIWSNHNANTHWAFPTSAETDAALSHAREAVADFLNAGSDEIGFGLNMTTLTFHLARALGRELGAGDAIIVTELDHHANIDPWRTLERERGVTILQVAHGSRDRRARLERSRPLPERPPREAPGDRCGVQCPGNDQRCGPGHRHGREADALSFVDAVHYAPHQLVDVKDWGCDFLACSAYKFHGPHVGVLYGKRDRLAALEFPKLEPAPETVPERLETGTQNHEGIVGAAAAINYLASLAHQDSSASPSSRRAATAGACSTPCTNEARLF